MNSSSSSSSRRSVLFTSSEDEDYIDTEATSIFEEESDFDDPEILNGNDIYMIHNDKVDPDIDENNYHFRQQMHLHCHHTHIPIIPPPIGYTSDDDDNSLPEIEEDLPIIIYTSNKVNEWQSLASKALQNFTDIKSKEKAKSYTSSSSSSESSTWDDSDEEDEDSLNDSYETESFINDDELSDIENRIPKSKSQSKTPSLSTTKQPNSRTTQLSTSKKKLNNNDSATSLAPRGRKVAVATLIHNSNTKGSVSNKASINRNPIKASLSGNKRERGHIRVIHSSDDSEERFDDELYDNDDASSSAWSEDSEETETDSYDENTVSEDEKYHRSGNKSVNYSLPHRRSSVSRVRSVLVHDDDNLISDEELSHAINTRSQRRSSSRITSSHGEMNDESASSRSNQASRASTLRSSSTASNSKSRSLFTPASRTTSRNSSALSLYNNTRNTTTLSSNNKNKKSSTIQPRLSKRLRLENVLSDNEDYKYKQYQQNIPTLSTTKKLNISPKSSMMDNKTSELGPPQRKSSRLHHGNEFQASNKRTERLYKRNKKNYKDTNNRELYALWG